MQKGTWVSYSASALIFLLTVLFSASEEDTAGMEGEAEEVETRRPRQPA